MSICLQAPINVNKLFTIFSMHNPSSPMSYQGLWAEDTDGAAIAAGAAGAASAAGAAIAAGADGADGADGAAGADPIVPGVILNSWV